MSSTTTPHYPNPAHIDMAALAFLAYRMPGLFDDGIICQRVNRSGMVDGRITLADIQDSLRRLERRGHVEIVTDLYGNTSWGATPQGKAQWVRDGAGNV